MLNIQNLLNQKLKQSLRKQNYFNGLTNFIPAVNMFFRFKNIEVATFEWTLS